MRVSMSEMFSPATAARSAEVQEEEKEEEEEPMEEETPQSEKRSFPAETEIGDESDSTTLYVKNLNWKTTEEGVRKLFGQVEGLRAVTLPKKKNSKGELLPLGFGFVVYATRQQALKALNRSVRAARWSVGSTEKLWMVMFSTSSCRKTNPPRISRAASRVQVAGLQEM